LIYNEYTSRLQVGVNEIETIKTNVKNYILNNNLQNRINSGYNSLINFDNTVASSASIMINNFMNDKKVILGFFEFMYMFITSAYLILWLSIFIFFLVYECEKIKCVYYLLFVFINVMVIIAIWEIVLSALFQGIRVFVRESPRVMKFVFTEDYILNGNTEDYPPKFGNKDALMPELFSICLNGNGDIFQKFIPKQTLDSILTQTKLIQESSSNLYTNIQNEIQNSNILLNPYNTYNNYSSIYSSIVKLEAMYNNLYLVSENFGYDDLRNITKVIRNKLDSCGMTYEYFVIRKEDCPRYSVILNQIQNNVEHIYHCYIIQDLSSTTRASYANYACDNDYINLSITFIKEISNILLQRINKLKDIQNNYALAWSNMNKEILSINNSLQNINSFLTDEINNKYILGNCSSVRFDLIDFSDFMHDKIGYKLKIMIIFSCLSGICGYILLYAILLILNKIKKNQKNIDNLGGGYSKYTYIKTSKPNYKYRNIKPPGTFRNNGNKISNSKNEQLLDNYNKNSNYDINNGNNRTNIVYNNVRKIEMGYMGNKNK
jgi:hypothetical protein